MPCVPEYTRFIPTGVGNTWTRRRETEIPPVHPHGCGEHKVRESGSQELNGSSPRVWGTRGGENGAAKSRRFIPTGVGNTMSAEDRFTALSVHPHGCGEHNVTVTSDDGKTGSSPRVWGTPDSS